VTAVVREQVTTIVREQVTAIVTKIVKNEVVAIMKEQVTTIAQDQLSKLPSVSSPSPSYADGARTPLGSQPSGSRTLSMDSTPSALTDTIYCTIDTSRVEGHEKTRTDAGAIRRGIEKEMRETQGRESWRCVAVTKDPRNETRIRVTCRDEAELGLVKEAAQKSGVAGVRVLRDQLFPVKVDNANRTVVLDENGEVRVGAVEMLGKENEVKIAKLAWLSGKNSAKAYGSMVVYVTKGSDAVRLLQGQYFHMAGESAYTRVFEQRQGPVQCYKCQQIGHKAFACEKPQRCGKCAQEGHQHRDCGNEILKCIPCGRPHESFSRHCRVFHTARDA